MQPLLIFEVFRALSIPSNLRKPIVLPSLNLTGLPSQDLVYLPPQIYRAKERGGIIVTVGVDGFLLAQYPAYIPKGAVL